VKLPQILRNGVIGTSIALLLATSSVAATRPNAAVPMAASSASSAALADGDGHRFGWIGLAIGVVAIALFAAFVVHDDDDDEDELSPG
jgi:hypothetical protein